MIIVNNCFLIQVVSDLTNEMYAAVDDEKIAGGKDAEEGEFPFMVKYFSKVL